MPRHEKDSFSGEPIEVFGPDKRVKVINSAAAKKGITGVAFDFDDLLTVLVSATATPGEQCYRFDTDMLELFRQVREKHKHTVILTSSGNDWVMRMARFHGQEKYFEGVEIHYLRSERVQKSSLELTGEQIVYDTKIPRIVGCNVLVDDQLSTSFPYPTRYDYTGIQVEVDHSPDRVKYARQALKYIGAL